MSLFLPAKPLTTTDPASTRVIVGLSGGVDSAVAAWTLCELGYQVEAIFMQNWEDDDEQCTARQDYRDAAGIADRLGIPLDTVNFAEEYWQRVFQHFLDEYQAARTPNPDILCNREIKFAAFLDHARRQGAELIATGHYARRAQLKELAAPWTLLRGTDAEKDQTYFLYTLGQSQLSRTLFPVGELQKHQVRAIAREAALHVHGKKDSTGICFIGERKFSRFLAEYVPAQPGDIVSAQGERLGRHNGLMFHTLGQRQGLGIGGRRSSGGEPWYVLDKDLVNNVLVVGQGHDHPALFRRELAAHDASWVSSAPPAGSRFRCTARVRHRQRLQPLWVEVGDNGRFEACFDTPVRAITPGQSIVLYDGESCLGGAVIDDFRPDQRVSY